MDKSRLRGGGAGFCDNGAYSLMVELRAVAAMTRVRFPLGTHKFL